MQSLALRWLVQQCAVRWELNLNEGKVGVLLLSRHMHIIQVGLQGHAMRFEAAVNRLVELGVGLGQVMMHSLVGVTFSLNDV